MAVDNHIIIMCIGFAFNYLVLYKSNKFFGNVMFAGLSIAIMAYSTDATFASIGLMCLLGSLINAVYDVLSKRTK